MKKSALVLFWMITCLLSSAQIQPGQWRDMLPYYNLSTLIPVENKIYCQAEYALVIYDKKEESYSKLSKVQGLSDVGVSAIVWSDTYKTLIVGYSSANIDIIKGKEIINIPDIRDKVGLGKKNINSISIINGNAFICCGFGIVVLDLEKLLIKDTYFIGEGAAFLSISDICSNGTTLYAATEKGIYSADLNDPNLVNYANWKKESAADNSFSIIRSFAGKVFAVTSDTNKILYALNNASWQISSISGTSGLKGIEVSNNKLILINTLGLHIFNESLDLERTFAESNIRNACISADGTVWFTKFGVINSMVNGLKDKSIFLGGPWSAQSFGVTAKDGVTWISHGGYSGEGYEVSHNSQGISVETIEGWTLLNRYYSPDIADNFDFTQVAIHPLNATKVFAASMAGKGLTEINNYGRSSIKTYNAQNSDGAIQTDLTDKGILDYRIGGLTFDTDNNLWFSCQYSNASPVVVMNAAGTSFTAHKFNNVLNEFKIRGSILSTTLGQKWMILGAGNGVFIFDDKNTPDVETDDEFIHIKNIPVSGVESNSMYNFVKCMAEDKDGNIWLGTRNGPIVFYNPEEILKGEAKANTILISRYDGTDHADPLLKDQTITGIAIDGGNRKWFATSGSGVFLISADGKKQIYNFREENSPLFSNSVRGVAVDNKTGEVFFATSKGTSVFKGSATEGSDVFGKVYAYPNPVREDFEGDIIITGLIANTIVKITDITGNLVYETTSVGGQAVWKGRNFSGQRVHTGVYLAFCGTPDGTQTAVAKILFIH